MKEKPILFAPEMVRAIRDGRKTQTRSIIKINPDVELERHAAVWRYYSTNRVEYVNVAPRHNVGDVLWVKETWTRFDRSSCDGDIKGDCFNDPPDDDGGYYLYRASHETNGDARWRPSIHMPRAAARIFLRVTGVRAERLWDISEDDARAEGAELFSTPNIPGVGRTYIQGFGELWDNIYAKRGFGWDRNCWVWRITFERIEGERI